MPQETESQRAARYAAQDVVDKLGVRPGDAVLIVGPKRDADLSRRIRRKAGRPPARADERADVVIFWPSSASTITSELRALRRRMRESGGIWVISSKRDRERAGRPHFGNDTLLSASPRGSSTTRSAPSPIPIRGCAS